MRLAFDVGGSHIAGALVPDGDDCSALAPASVQLNRDVSFREFWNSWKFLIQRLRQKTPWTALEAVGCAVPDPFDFDAGVCRIRGLGKLESQYGSNWRRELALLLPEVASERIRFIHDAHAYILGEVGYGAARGARRALGMTLGTGLGAAFYADGRVLTSGEEVPPNGVLYSVPWRGRMLEDFVSARALCQRLRELGGQATSAREVAEQAALGRPEALQAWQELGEALGAALAPILVRFRPELVIMSGGLSRSAAYFLPALEAALSEAVPFKVSTLGECANLLGALPTTN